MQQENHSSEEEIIEELTETVRELLDRTAWYKNIKIQNKAEERKQFKQARENGENFRPNFRFREYEDTEETLREINQCIEATEKIEQRHLERYGAEELTAEELQEFFKEIFEEIKLYVKLAADIEDEESWRKYSEKLWPMTDEERVETSREKVLGLETEELKETVSPEELAEMFREEVDRLGMEYDVEVRQVGGCFNIPEERTVVVAEGENGERKFSRKETRMLTMHELFHVVRAYNGFKAGEKTGFPEILGLHTPFYDRAEEGGALYREEQTDTAYGNKEFDYRLRLIAAYEVYRSDNFVEDFQDIVEKLIDLGGSVDRSFYLVARNREALRHHIYQAGRDDWRGIPEKEKMLIGKVNEEWADRFQKEIGGMIQEPEIGPEKLFDFRFNS
jgi:hypothetical protein